VTASQRAGGASVTSQIAAAADGSFSLSVPAELGDQIELTATDASGNVSPVSEAQAGPQPTATQVAQRGDVELQFLATGSGAIDLPFPAGNERYTVIVEALNPGTGPFTAHVVGDRGTSVRGLAGAAATSFEPAPSESGLRETERRVLPTLPRTGPRRAPTPAADNLGDTRDFHVVNTEGVVNITDPNDFDEVTATLRYIGSHTLVYVDDRTPPANVPHSLIEEIGDNFDDDVYPTDRAVFGNESDEDGNGKVIILMTQSVNATNVSGSGTVRVGFFFGIDLLPATSFNPFSNHAEMFYAVVPDPDAELGGYAISLNDAPELLTSVFAHEFVHMIVADYRVVIPFSPAIEALWLEEGLAHMGETVNGFDRQNRLRSALYLNSPSSSPLSSGDDTLERRGAAWLLLQYLRDRYHATIPDLLHRLVDSRNSGIVNIEGVTDRSFPFLFHEFATALYADGMGLTLDPVFDFPFWDLRQQYAQARTDLGVNRIPNPYLDPGSLFLPGGSGGGTTLQQAGDSPAFFEVSATRSGTFPVVVQGTRSATLQVTILRTR